MDPLNPSDPALDHDRAFPSMSVSVTSVSRKPIIGITPIDFFSLENGVHFQIAYGEKSSWYESVAGIFGFGMEITVPNGETEQVDGQEEIQVQVDV